MVNLLIELKGILVNLQLLLYPTLCNWLSTINRRQQKEQQQKLPIKEQLCYCWINYHDAGYYSDGINFSLLTATRDKS
jgi:hypothetical protein